MDIYSVGPRLKKGAEQVIKGKALFLEALITGLLGKGHVLIEDMPGVGKTTVAKTLAHLVADGQGKPLSFKRIQCTPDVLPYDITGVDVFDPETRSFRFLPGPVFAHFVLADEINRTTPKVQSALLEAMAEQQVTIGTTTHHLSEPFMVIATQNPVETEGTYPLPVAQLDRFMMRLSVGYPDRDAELEILSENPAETVLHEIQPVVQKEELLAARAAVTNLYCHQELKESIADLVRSTREHPDIHLGCSPRAGLHLLMACKARALLHGRNYVTDEDVLFLAPAVLAHRVQLRDPRARAEPLIQDLAHHYLKKHVALSNIS
ncbi:MoxR family ATPase [Treponema sp. J25]|uniref:AAA family ATPase n=1 Tax=Treponema sp. J25 TaxID=2094121 RepID=UPI00105236EA|nr:MoxR family ATPase [Treponema sp. J25]TCW61967.1 magnesium chelatase [Treponema sp. J25]